jgi:ribonuclease HII
MKLSLTNKIEAGCDEAGRGCLAGPVFAAAVIIPNGIRLTGVKDSKKLSHSLRQQLRIEIENTCIWSVGMCSPEEIDELNILWASVKAMHKALNGLSQSPDIVVVDGNRFKPWNNIPYETVIKGDNQYLHIAAASILAKTHRDEWMQHTHHSFPHYGWDKNKGYPTKMHIKAIADWGISPHHRLTFMKKIIHHEVKST